VEEELREAHERAIWLARFPEENPSPIVRVSREGKILYCNPAARDLPGWTCEVGCLLPKLLQSQIVQVMGEGKEKEQEVELGGRFYYFWAAPFLADGYVNLYGRDITDHKQMEEELRRSHDELEKRVRERTEELTRSHQRLQQLAAQLLKAQEEERRRIAQELHDSIGASLGAIKFKMVNAIERMEQGAPALGSLKDLIPIVQLAIEESRRIMADLRPSMLDDLGILPTISWHCREFEKIYSHIGIEKRMDITEKDVPAPLKTVIYRILQEAMNNIAKHSNANLISLFLKKKDDRIELVIEDNGIGFDMEGIEKGDLLLSEWVIFGIFRSVEAYM
jgi:signal transduction histidine kinase